MGHPLGPPLPEAAFPVISQPLARQPVLGLPETAPPMVHQPMVHQPSHPVPIVVPSSPAQLERARSNPLTPGTPVCPPRYPDRPEPIKLSYKKL